MTTQQTELIAGEKPLFELSVDAQLLTKRLMKAEVGETVTYAEMNELIHSNVQKKSRHLMQRARITCQREKRMVFDAIENVGLKRLNDSEIAQTGERVMSGINRAARRGFKRINCADYNAIDNEAKIKMNTHLSMLGALNAITSAKKMPLLEDKVREVNDRLSLANTLKMFTGNANEG